MIIPEDEDSITALPPRRRWHLAAVDVTPLRRHRDFRLLFIGRLVSFSGSMISSVAFPYHVYQLGRVLCVIGCALCALALPLFRAYDAGLYHLAPDPRSGSVKREEA